MDQQEADQRVVAMEQARGEAAQEGDLSADQRAREVVAWELARREAEPPWDPWDPPDGVVAETAFEAVKAFQPPPGVFEFPWQKCSGGLGVPAASAAADLRDVFFRSLVDGRVAAVGVPGDRLLPVASKRTMFDDLEAWLATASDGEVDPVWRSVLEGPKPAA